MLNRALLYKLFWKLPELKGLPTYGCKASVNCYRSRIPFINTETACDISTLLTLCAHTPEEWIEISKATTNLWKQTTLYINGLCTDRSATYSREGIHNLVRSSVRHSSFGTQILLVNVTARSQYPSILDYVNNAPEVIKVFQTTTRYADKPVEYVGARINYPDGTYNSTTQYVVFTTLWDYDLNLSLVYTSLNHLLMTSTSVPECDRVAKYRLGYTWFKKYFEGQDVTQDIVAYFEKEYLNKLEDAKKAALAKSLTTFQEAKVNIGNNITTTIADYHNRIAELERKIDEYYSGIRKLTLEKLAEVDKTGMLENAIKIFQGMLAKGMLTGFNYRVANSYLRSFSWRVRIPITYWEDDEAKHWLNTYANKPYYQALFKAMFLDKLITPWCEQYMTIDFQNNYEVCTNSSGTDANDDCIFPPHPHVGRYNCFGNNAAAAKKALNSRDVGTAITICMNAVMQLNMTDHTVVSYFMRQCVPEDTSYPDTAFLEYRGALYTPTQLYNLYKSEGGFSNGETNQANNDTEETTA